MPIIRRWHCAGITAALRLTSAHTCTWVLQTKGFEGASRCLSRTGGLSCMPSCEEAVNGGKVTSHSAGYVLCDSEVIEFFGET